MSDDNITYGKFVTKKTTRAAIVVDCSGWADPADGPITYGKFVTKKKTRPAIVSKLHVPALRLQVRPVAQMPPERLLEIIRAMVEGLHAAAPDLSLEYDPAQSGLAKDSQGATVAELVLVPRTPPLDVDERLSELMQTASKLAKQREAELVKA
jgi:hypothetical protein